MVRKNVLNESLNNILTNLLRTASSNSCGLLVAPALKEKSSLRKWEGTLKMHDQRTSKWNKTSIPYPNYMAKTWTVEEWKRLTWQVPTVQKFNSLIRLSKPHVHILQATKVSSTLKTYAPGINVFFAVNIKAWDLFQLMGAVWPSDDSKVKSPSG